MLAIDQRPLKSFGILQASKLQVPIDDYVMHMVLRRGLVVSCPRKPIYVEAIDMAPHNDSVHCFKMSLVDSFQLMDTYPEFADGIVGSWRLVGSTGHIKLIKAFDDRNHAEAVKKFLLSEESHAIASERYSKQLLQVS